MDILAEFDGRHTDTLEQIWAEHRHSDLRDVLIRLASDTDPVRQVGATWLLRRCFEDDVSGAVPVVRELLASVTHPDAQLHLLQTLDGLVVSELDALPIFGALLTLSSSENKFVKAWALGDLVQLADQHEAFRGEVLSVIDQRLATLSASGRARLRRAGKGKHWLTPLGL